MVARARKSDGNSALSLRYSRLEKHMPTEHHGIRTDRGRIPDSAIKRFRMFDDDNGHK